MPGSPTTHSRTSAGQRRPVLDWKAPCLVLIMVAMILVSVSLATDWSSPSLWIDFTSQWPADWAAIAAGSCATALVVLPILWICWGRTLDLFSLSLALNALLLVGYFFLDTTAEKIPNSSDGILEFGSLVVLINAVGFGVLFLAMGAVYISATLFQARIPPLKQKPELYDQRLAWVLRATGAAVVAVIAFPMLSSGTIPLLAENAAEARFSMIRSDTARALYHAGTAVLPFVMGGLLMLIIRKPIRALGVDGAITAAALITQILTSNRLPVAISMFVTITLLSLEKKLPRLVLIAAFVGVLFLYTGLSGFSAILRQDKTELSEGNVIKKSLDEAFLGDNLIDLRDAAWVLSHWDFEPLNGKTYLGGLVSMVPSGIFPLKKEWHLGLTGIRIVGWNPDEHFGLRITFFGESFLNFGPAGVIGFAIVEGCLFGVLLRLLHLGSLKRPACLHYNLKIVMLMQMCLPLANTSDAFTFWAIAVFLAIQWILVDLLIHFGVGHASDFSGTASDRA